MLARCSLMVGAETPNSSSHELLGEPDRAVLIAHLDGAIGLTGEEEKLRG